MTKTYIFDQNGWHDNLFHEYIKALHCIIIDFRSTATQITKCLKIFDLRDKIHRCFGYELHYLIKTKGRLVVLSIFVLRACSSCACSQMWSMLFVDYFCKWTWQVSILINRDAVSYNTSILPYSQKTVNKIKNYQVVFFVGVKEMIDHFDNIIFSLFVDNIFLEKISRIEQI